MQPFLNGTFFKNVHIGMMQDEKNKLGIEQNIHDKFVVYTK